MLRSRQENALRAWRLTRSCIAVTIVAALVACNGNGALSPVTSGPGSPFLCDAAPPITLMAIARSPLDVAFVPSQPAPVKRVYQPDWAGPVLFAPAELPLRIPAHRFCAVEGEWIVPTAKPTINCSNPAEPTDGSSLWIAIDGWSATFKAHAKGKNGKYYSYDSTDILQAGSESDVSCYRGGPLKSYKTSSYFWIEWAGTKNIAVTRRSRNLAVRAGDRIYVGIAATTTGAHAWRQATLWFVNETTGLYLPPRTFQSGCVDCGTPYRRPAMLFGNTAEWMTEATFYSSNNPKLPNTLDDFGTVEMNHVVTTDQDGVTYDLTRPLGAILNIDWMTWNGVPLSENGTLLACATIDGAREVSFARAPYVIATPGQQGDLEPKPKRCR